MIGSSRSLAVARVADDRRSNTASAARALAWASSRVPDGCSRRSNVDALVEPVAGDTSTSCGEQPRLAVAVVAGELARRRTRLASAKATCCGRCASDVVSSCSSTLADDAAGLDPASRTVSWSIVKRGGVVEVELISLVGELDPVAVELGELDRAARSRLVDGAAPRSPAVGGGGSVIGWSVGMNANGTP